MLNDAPIPDLGPIVSKQAFAQAICKPYEGGPIVVNVDAVVTRPDYNIP
jgi:hypothetical protein